MAITPAAPNEVTVDTFQLYCCRLDQPALGQLIEAVRDRTASPQVTLEARWYCTRLRQDNLDAVCVAISRSLNPGDPRRLDQLRIEALGTSRAVVVELLEDVATVTVESVDAPWALGRAEQIRRILRHAGGCSERQRWRPWLCAVAGCAAVAGVLAALWLFGVTTTTTLAGALIGGGAAAGFLIARWMDSKGQAIIWIDGVMPRRGWQGWSVSDRVAFLALLVALLATVIPLSIG